MKMFVTCLIDNSLHSEDISIEAYKNIDKYSIYIIHYFSDIIPTEDELYDLRSVTLLFREKCISNIEVETAISIENAINALCNFAQSEYPSVSTLLCLPNKSPLNCFINFIFLDLIRPINRDVNFLNYVLNERIFTRFITPFTMVYLWNLLAHLIPPQEMQ